LVPTRDRRPGHKEVALAVKHRATFTKRERERARQQHREEKEAKRLQRLAEKKEREPMATGEDPDIAGIVPGPQPPQDID
jgi:hypothetical protein